jgi:hypothetical protein
MAETLTPAKEPSMPHILVVTENPEDARRTIVYRERIAPSDLESRHFSGQLVERVGWAVSDADRIEHSDSRDERVIAAR